MNSKKIRLPFHNLKFINEVDFMFTLLALSRLFQQAIIILASVISQCPEYIAGLIAITMKKERD